MCSFFFRIPLYPDMTVLEYLRFVSELKKVPKKERDEQIREIMRMVEITDVEERLIRNLSKGYKQRVGLAQAIIGYPDIIILDEPMVGLDPKQIIEIRELIKTLAGKQHTIILSSHILSEVSTLCDHIMIISHGRLVASDSPEGLQKLMVKSTEIEVIALGDSEKAEKILAEIEHIRSFSLEEKERFYFSFINRRHLLPPPCLLLLRSLLPLLRLLLIPVLGKYLALLTVFALPVIIIGIVPFILSFFGAFQIGPSYTALCGYFLYGALGLAIGLFLSSLTESIVISAVLTFTVLLPKL